MAGACSSASPALCCCPNARKESHPYINTPRSYVRNAGEQVRVRIYCQDASSRLLARYQTHGWQFGARFKCVKVSNFSVSRGGHFSSRHPGGLGWSVTCALPAHSAQPMDGGGSVSIGEERCESALIWHKHDLRLDDHPGWSAAASTCQNVTPVYIFDPAIIAGLPRNFLPPLLEAVEGLRDSLRRRGSDLIVRSGSSPAVLLQLAQQVGATEMWSEEEVESSWRQLASQVEEAVTGGDERMNVKYWTAPMYGFKEAGPMPEDYREFKSACGPLLPPVEVPPVIPPLPQALEPGTTPPLSALEALLPPPSLAPRPRPQPKDQSYRVGGGWEAATDLFSAYLRIQEATARSEWQEFFFYVWGAESRPGASFSNLFSDAMSLGLISPRRALNETVEYERQRNGGRLSPFGFSTFTGKAAVHTLEANEFHEVLGRKAVRQGGRRGQQIRFWRWRGALLEYATAGTSGPAILLVHGFGASWEHYRSNLRQLAESGNRVWALTLPGFGRSAKPRIGYSQYSWGDVVGEFIEQVVGEEVVLAGNSIGGYTAAQVASDRPLLVSHLVLLNSAGRMRVEEAPPPPYEAQGGSGVARAAAPLAWFLTRLLFLYLQRNAAVILRRCYPKSHDPGAVQVVESIFYLPKPRPLNALVDQYGGPVMVLQGRHDPLNNAVLRAERLKALCPHVRVELVEAGHCPHDEVPEESNALLMHFARSSGREGMEIGRERSTKETEVGGDGILDVIVEEAMLSVGGKDAIGKES